jgi:hypothetical protein
MAVGYKPGSSEQGAFRLVGEKTFWILGCIARKYRVDEYDNVGIRVRSQYNFPQGIVTTQKPVEWTRRFIDTATPRGLFSGVERAGSTYTRW